MPESAENTNSNGLPLTPVSATAVIVGQSETSNFVLGAIPGESYCSLASGDDATEASVVTDANGSCRAIPAAVTTTTVTSSTTAVTTTTAVPVAVQSTSSTTTAVVVTPPIFNVAAAETATSTTTTQSAVKPMTTTVLVPVAKSVTITTVAQVIAPSYAPTTIVPKSETLPTKHPETLLPFTVSRNAGPPGSALVVHGGSYGPTCSSVIVSLGNSVLLHTSIVPGRSLSAHSIYIPGDTQPGAYQLSVRCATSQNAFSDAAVFSVVPQSPHRSGFASSLLLPSQINFSAKAVAGSLALAGASIPFVAFPAEFINAALEEHEEEITSWSALLRRKMRRKEIQADGEGSWKSLLTLMGVLLATAGLYGLLDPTFGLDTTSLALYLGLLAGLVVITIVADLPSALYMKSKFPSAKVTSHALPGALLVALICVLLSRALHFEPGYLYGTVAGLRIVNSDRIPGEAAGRSSALTAATTMLVSMVAWLLREPLVRYAAEIHAPFIAIAAEACLVSVFVAGIQGVLLNMLPVKFLPGRSVFMWSKRAWLAIVLVAGFAFIHLLLGSGSGYVGSVSDLWAALVFVLIIAVLTAGVWIFFMRYDAKHPRDESGQSEPEVSVDA